MSCNNSIVVYLIKNLTDAISGFQQSGVDLCMFYTSGNFNFLIGLPGASLIDRPRLNNEMLRIINGLTSYVGNCCNVNCDNADAVNVLTRYLNELKSFNC